MAVARKVLTLALMAAVVFPMAVNAQVAAPILGDVDPSYNTTPTLAWTSESGPTTFDVTIGDGTPVSVSAGDMTDMKWDARDCTKDGDVTTCNHTYEVPTALAVTGDVSWSVVGQLDSTLTANEEDTDYTTAPASKTLTIYGDIVMTLDVDAAEVKPGGTVVATVSMDNTTNGAISVDELTFSVSYDTNTLSLADADVVATGRASALTPAPAIDAGKAAVVLDGAIAAGTGGIATLTFSVAEGAAATASQDITLAFVGADGVVKSDTVTGPGGDPLELNPADWTDDAMATVLFVPAQGDVDGNGTVEIADLLITLKAAAGLSFTADISDYVKEYGAVGVPCAAFILGELAP